MKKKLLILLCALMATITASAYDFAVQNSDGVTIYYNKLTNATCEVTSRSSSGSSSYNTSTVNIPKTVSNDGITYSVTSIGEKAFYLASNLITVEIPNSVTSIGDYAFESCSSLTSVTIPNSVTSIGVCAFSHCSRLKEFTFPPSVTEISQSTFQYCGFTSITIPNTITSIGSSAFKRCESLESVNILGPITKIDSYTFSECYGLTSVAIPNSVTSIGYEAFSNCRELTSVNIPNSVTDIEKWAFYNCFYLTTLSIGNSVTSIGYGAFQGCRELTSVDIPKSVTSIDGSAFSGCSSLITVTVNNDNPNNISMGSSYVFPSSQCTLYVPKGSKELYATANVWKNFKNIEEIDPYTKVGLTYAYTDDNHTAYKVTGFTDELPTIILIPNEYNGLPVTEIGDRAFAGFNPYKISTFILPNTIKKIGNHAFNQCNLQEGFTIPLSVEYIGAYAFCKSFQHYINGSYLEFSLTLPSSVTHIGNYAFSDNEGIVDLTFDASVEEIPIGAFQHCFNLNSAKITSRTVTSIGKSAFMSNYRLTNVEFPESLVSIGEMAFETGNPDEDIYEAGNLSEILLPPSVQTIGFCAFQNSGLKSLKVCVKTPDNLSFDSSAFGKGYGKQTQYLYVPNGSKSAYQALYWTKSFNYIIEYKISEQIELTDGESYIATEDRFDVDINYTRNFNNTEWQPLYVPFNMSYEEWSEYADVAEVHNVLGYDTDGNGEIDEIIIEFNKLNSGEIVPNVPYVIKAKNAGEVTFECIGKNLLAAPAEEGTVECSSTKMTYSFHGVYQPKTDMHTSGAYHLSGGAFHHTTTDEAVLPPNRFYMMVTPKTGGYNPASAPQMIRMKVNGDDTTTSIEGIEVDIVDDGIYYDLMGRKVVNPAQGFYIKNGKKVFVK